LLFSVLLRAREWNDIRYCTLTLVDLGTGDELVSPLAMAAVQQEEWTRLAPGAHLCSCRFEVDPRCRDAFLLEWNCDGSGPSLSLQLVINAFFARHRLWHSVGGPGMIRFVGNVFESETGTRFEVMVFSEREVSDIIAGGSFVRLFRTGCADAGLAQKVVSIRPFPCSDTVGYKNAVENIVMAKWRQLHRRQPGLSLLGGEIEICT